MIDPKEEDIGRSVLYTGNRFPGGKLESGIITALTTFSVFIRYGDDRHSKATRREDLEWKFAKT